MLHATCTVWHAQHLHAQMSLLHAMSVCDDAFGDSFCLTISMSWRRAILLNVNEPETRGVALGMQTVMDDCGRGLGPLLVAGILAVLKRCACSSHRKDCSIWPNTPAIWRAAALSQWHVLHLNGLCLYMCDSNSVASVIGKRAQCERLIMIVEAAVHAYMQATSSRSGWDLQMHW